jgi:hypothetical protein
MIQELLSIGNPPKEHAQKGEAKNQKKRRKEEMSVY